jgi:hypothetical protein
VQQDYARTQEDITFPASVPAGYLEASHSA